MDDGVGVNHLGIEGMMRGDEAEKVEKMLPEWMHTSIR